ncbi:MAG: hypothetical protein PF636_08665 [Actinomycetota bacterium]|jgi:hypothetical protein|nr:hypothetical protein [Actinomycetota bacterium]
MGVSDTFSAQLADVVAQYHTDLADINSSDWEVSARASVAFLTRARAVIERVAGAASPYVEQCADILAENAVESYKANRLLGVLNSLRADVDAGYLESVTQLIHGEVFGDFLEMADHLCAEGYKDAAAVIAGSALESHLRALAAHASVVWETDGRPHKADRLNADLTKSGVYAGLDQKNVTGWLGLRNDAAHGNYDAYTQQQVRLLVASIRDFLSRHPA